MKTIISEEIVYLREAEVLGDVEYADELYHGDYADEIRWSEPKQTHRNVRFEDEVSETDWQEIWN